jgi:hypothetical protein
MLNACHIIPTYSHYTIHLYRHAVSMFIATLLPDCQELGTE